MECGTFCSDAVNGSGSFRESGAEKCGEVGAIGDVGAGGDVCASGVASGRYPKMASFVEFCSSSCDMSGCVGVVLCPIGVLDAEEGSIL